MVFGVWQNEKTMVRSWKWHRTADSVWQYFLHSILLSRREKTHEYLHHEKMCSGEKPKMSTFLVHTDFVTSSNSFYRSAKSLEKRETIPIPVHAPLLVVVSSNQAPPHTHTHNAVGFFSLASNIFLMIRAAVCARMLKSIKHARLSHTHS